MSTSIGAHSYGNTPPRKMILGKRRGEGGGGYQFKLRSLIVPQRNWYCYTSEVMNPAKN